MARKATNQVTAIGIDIGKNSFHLIDPNVRFGSKPVLADLAQRRRLSEAELTSTPRKRTLPLEGRLSGVERSYQRRGPNRRL